MKILHLVIIVIATIIPLCAFGIYVMIHPIFGGIAPSPTFKGYIQIDTPGLEKTYKIGQPINFSVLIQGFGRYPCHSPQIVIYNNAQTKPVFNYTTQSVSCPDSSEHYIYYLPSQNNTFSTMINETGNYTAKISVGQDSYQKQFSVMQTGDELDSMNNTRCINSQTCDEKLIYFVGPHVKPKDVLYDYSYDGIDKDNGMVSINGQTYYQMTLQNTVYDLKKGTSVSFQNVTFAFPQGVMITPGADLLMVNVTFPEGFQEIYGEHKVNQDGSTNYGGILVPTPYGPHYAVNSVTVLGNHLKPQAGITIYHDSIKLVVSK